MMPPFPEDCAVCELAAALALEVSRYERVEITDLAAVKAAGLMKQAPDYQRIGKALRAGAEVPGAALGAVEYRLRRNRDAA
jgi:hypothetical protein